MNISLQGKQSNSMKSSQKIFKEMTGHSTKRALNSPMKKSNGNLAAKFSSSAPVTNSNLAAAGMFDYSYKANTNTSDLERIEAEYIKNLQQQVYFLELEANYLREQARKASELQPQMTAEAKRMVARLREIENELEVTRLEVKQKETSNETIKVEKEKILGKLKAAEDSHQREKHLLLDEIGQLKKEKELLDKSLINKDAQIFDLQQQLEMSNSVGRTSENKIRMLESQLSQNSDQLKLLQQTLDEKRVELLKAEERLHHTEERYYSSTAMINDKIKEDLRDEIRLLKQKLKETEMNVSQDRYLKIKMNDVDGAQISQENAMLRQKISELQLQFEKEHSLQQTFNATDTTVLRKELDDTKESLRLEKEHLKHAIEQLAKHEQLTKSQTLNAATLHSHLAELSGKHKKLETENGQLKADKDVLLERVSELKDQIKEKQLNIESLQKRIHASDNKLKVLEPLQSTIRNQKWEEFSRLAESMKSLSKSITQQSPLPWNNSTNIIEYSS